MTINDITLEQYDNMSLQEKENFYNQISTDQLSYCTYTLAIRQRKTKNIKIRGYKQPHGHLTFIEELKRTDKHVTNFSYLCICDCGKWHILTNRHFDTEGSISCGCHRIEKTKERNTKDKETGIRGKDLSDQIFGDLKPIEKTQKRARRSIIWKCICINCGKEQEVIGSMLTQNKRMFCEFCSQRKSMGEKLITQLLENNNHNYIKEFSFSNCRFLDTNRLAKFDFYVDDKYIIEFDGKQHFQPERFNNYVTKEEALSIFVKTKQHDEFKNQWCKDNNVPLIRIPYTHLDDLCIEDLIPETSTFLLK